MFGWRARLGLVVPSTNTTVEPEYAALGGDGVDFFSTRVMACETTDPNQKVAAILAMHDRIEEAADELASCEPHAIAYACTSGSFLKGVASDEELCGALSSRLGIPVITTSSALLQALGALAAHRLAVVTPYISQVSEGVRSYLAASGHEVVATHDLEMLSNLDKGRLDADASYRAARALGRLDADAVVISCTNWRTREAAALLEQDLGIPVVSSNLATVWALLRTVGVDTASAHPSRLYQLPGYRSHVRSA